MKETKLQKTKTIVRQIVKSCLSDHITDITNEQWKDLDFCLHFVEEMEATIEMMNNVSVAKRTRELDTLVQHYFGMDTAEDLLDALKPTECINESEVIGQIGKFVFVSKKEKKNG